MSAQSMLMLRSLARFLGFLLLAAAFIGLVLDGARTLADGALAWTSLGDLAAALSKDGLAALPPGSVAAVAATLLKPLAPAPAALVGLGLGVLLLWAGQKPPEPIGFAARR